MDFWGFGGGTWDGGSVSTVEVYEPPPAIAVVDDPAETPTFTSGGGSLADVLRTLSGEESRVTAWDAYRAGERETFLPGERAGIPSSTGGGWADFGSKLVEELGKIGQTALGVVRSGFSSGSSASQRVSTSEILRERAVPVSQPWGIMEALGLSRLFGGGGSASGGGSTATGTGVKPESGSPAAFSFAGLMPWAIGAAVILAAWFFMRRA